MTPGRPEPVLVSSLDPLMEPSRSRDSTAYFLRCSGKLLRTPRSPAPISNSLESQSPFTGSSEAEWTWPHACSRDEAPSLGTPWRKAQGWR